MRSGFWIFWGLMACLFIALAIVIKGEVVIESEVHIEGTVEEEANFPVPQPPPDGSFLLYCREWEVAKDDSRRQLAFHARWNGRKVAWMGICTAASPIDDFYSLNIPGEVLSVGIMCSPGSFDLDIHKGDSIVVVGTVGHVGVLGPIVSNAKVYRDPVEMQCKGENR